ncbi:isoprenyl transferase [Alphaproteobacteria bacterium]|nr:isoprenyl transferase [Alphaproteobacteria bacterium]
MSIVNLSEKYLNSPPKHVAIIMDGNGRWAKSRSLPRFAGHQRGAKVVKKIVHTAPDLGIKYLTLFAFSSENWKRPQDEVSDLMALLKLYISRELVELHRNNVRVRILGEISVLSEEIQKMLNTAVDTTKNNSGLELCLALNYGSRIEIIKAVKLIAKDISKGLIELNSVDEKTLGAYLDTSDIPDPDLLIRTSGEQRLSNFLLWQLAYTELIFVNCLWPDFTPNDLEKAIQEYQQRDRRYGAASV